LRGKLLEASTAIRTIGVMRLPRTPAGYSPPNMRGFAPPSTVDDQIVGDCFRAREHRPSATAICKGGFRGSDDLFRRQLAAGSVLAAGFAQVEERKFSGQCRNGNRIDGSHCRTSSSGRLWSEPRPGASLSGARSFREPDRRPWSEYRRARRLCTPVRCIPPDSRLQCS